MSIWSHNMLSLRVCVCVVDWLIDDANSCGSNLWSNALPTRPRRRPVDVGVKSQQTDSIDLHVYT